MFAFLKRLYRRFRKPRPPVDPVTHYARETLREIWIGALNDDDAYRIGKLPANFFMPKKKHNVDEDTYDGVPYEKLVADSEPGRKP
jgi:hypothetical protein